MGNVLVKFAMRFTHPITRKSHNTFRQEPVKGGLPPKATPSKKLPSGKERLLVSDIKKLTIDYTSHARTEQN